MVDHGHTEKGKEKPKTRNGFALTGLILGIASVLLASIGIIPILGIVFSSIGLAKVKDRSGKGKVQAWIGLILSVKYRGRSLLY